MRIDGKEIARQILSDLKTRVESLREQGVIPTLAIILTSDDPSTESYVRQKKLKAEEIGAQIELIRMGESVSSEDLKNKIEDLSINSKVHGIIVQRPLPPQIDSSEISSLVRPEKDVDGFNKNSPFDVPVAKAVIRLLQEAQKTSGDSTEFTNWLKNKNLAVVGKGETAGRPIIRHFEKLGIKPTIIDSQTQNRGEALLGSDVVVSAVGKKDTIKQEQIKKGAILIGVGLSTHEGKLHGDYNDTDIEGEVSFYSPTPGGVGPVNVAFLMKNLLDASGNR